MYPGLAGVGVLPRRFAGSGWCLGRDFEATAEEAWDQLWRAKKCSVLPWKICGLIQFSWWFQPWISWSLSEIGSLSIIFIGIHTDLYTISCVYIHIWYTLYDISYLIYDIWYKYPTNMILVWYIWYKSCIYIYIYIYDMVNMIYMIYIYDIYGEHYIKDINDIHGKYDILFMIYNMYMI